MARSQEGSEVRAARLPESRAIARLHAQVLHEGFISSFGERFLERVYRSLIRSPEAVVLVASENDIVGFVVATSSPFRLWRDLARPWFLLGTAPAVLRSLRPWRIKGAFEVVRHVRRGGSSAELLTIAVGPPARRAGLGSGLVMEVEEELRRRGADRMTVSVRIDNRPARAFFERMGFHPLGRADLHHGRAALRYEKPLVGGAIRAPLPLVMGQREAPGLAQDGGN
jgi:ribosomal protein S18 acetylase RimI-like enzyme